MDDGLSTQEAFTTHVSLKLSAFDQKWKIMKMPLERRLVDPRMPHK
jgi:hypothetical protein